MNDTPQPAARFSFRRYGPAWLLTVALLALFSINPALQSGWLRALGIPPEKRPYADAWVIAAGSESLAQGLDPLRENPHDPWGRPMNYPRIVASLAHAAGVRTQDAPMIALGFVAVFLLSTATLFSGLSVHGSWILAALTLSPPVMFAVERANLDLVVFAGVCSLGLHAVGWVAAATIPALAAAKLYPAFGCISLLDTRGRFALSAALACGLYAIFIRADLMSIRHATPHQAPLSWGVSTLALNLRAPSLAWLSWLIPWR